MGLFKKKREPKEELKQNLEEKAEFQNLYQIYLLFEEKPVKPEAGIIHTALEETFGAIDIVSPSPALTSFAVKKYLAQFKDGACRPRSSWGTFRNSSRTPLTHFPGASSGMWPTETLFWSGAGMRFFFLT